jgi:YebC/PmpR family DNA-binding regulatory protein
VSGHSKWANIQHRKNAQDARRGKLFTRLIREITTAARLGEADPNDNPRLRLAVDKAMAANMPKDTVERAIKRGAGDVGGQAYEEIRYEGYGSGGVAVMVDCMTDNRNRTAGDVRYAFSKHGGNLGANGSVAYLFDRVGILNYPPHAGEERLLEAALEAGAEDIVTNEDGSVDVLTAPDEFDEIKTKMVEAGLDPQQAEVTERPSTVVDLDAESAASVMKLLEALEDLDDVQQVYANAAFPDEVLAEA